MIPSPPPARLYRGEKIIQILECDGWLYGLTSKGRILQAHSNWTWYVVPGPQMDPRDLRNFPKQLITVNDDG
jgi:hypothetical protein